LPSAHLADPRFYDNLNFDHDNVDDDNVDDDLNVDDSHVDDINDDDFNADSMASTHSSGSDGYSGRQSCLQRCGAGVEPVSKPA
jgi:hypothetical protein